MQVIHRKIWYFTYKITLLLFLSRDKGKQYILLPVSKIGIFRDRVAPPDFAENTDMAKDLDYKTGLDFWGLLFWKNPRLIGGLIRYILEESNFNCWVHPAMRFTYCWRKMAELFTNSRDPDQTPRSVASDLGLHCLPITLL